MKNFLLLLLLFYTTTLFSQQPNWGFAPEITVSGGSSITCSVYDTDLGTTRTTSQSGVDSYINSDGVVAWVSAAGTVGGIIYDMNLHAFRTTTFSSNSGNKISNSMGVISYVSSAGTVGGATYDFCLQSWKYTTFSNNSGNSVKNNHGVIAFVSSAGTVGGAVYDPEQQAWKYTTFSNNSGNVIENSQGIISYVSTAGTVGGAVYDIKKNSWQYTTFSNNSGNTVVNKDGVVAYKSSAGTLGAAAYNFNSGNWSYTTFSNSTSNTTPSISNGTVTWSNSSGNQKAGFTGSSWSTGSNTQVSCAFSAIAKPNCDNNMSYFWCMSIGANSYNYNAGDGHNISRRWAWKRYIGGGSHNPELNVSNSLTNRTCDAFVDFPTSSDEPKHHPKIHLYSPSKNSLHIESKEASIKSIAISNALGQVVSEHQFISEPKECSVDCNFFSQGVHFALIHLSNGQSVQVKYLRD